MVERRSFVKALWLAAVGLIARATTTSAQAASHAAPAGIGAPDGETADLVPTVATRADVAKATAHEFVRVQSMRIGAPPVDFLYRIQQGGGVRTANDIELGPGLWGKMEFPGGTANAWAFGAIGNGAVDDTVALQAFFDYVTQKGVRGVIPAGVYRTTQSLRIGSVSKDSLARGFIIEGAGRTGLQTGRSSSGTVIRYDGVQVPAVILWKGTAWRDGCLQSFGIACRRPDAAEYGLLIESSEVSNLIFENLHVENAKTAFGLLRGTGNNGEFCSWRNIQTSNVLNFFYSDAGQAYGLRFQDIFCYYRPGGVLCRFDMKSIGGGARLINFDASPVAPAGHSPEDLADTTFIELSGMHNAPITVIGGRMEHITTVLRTSAGHPNLVIHTQVQFIGAEFTTDLNEATVSNGRATVEMTAQALTSVLFTGCNFSPSLFQRADLVVAVTAWPECRGSIRFFQCGNWGYRRPPSATGPFGEMFEVSWQDCVTNGTSVFGDPKRQMIGRRFERQLGQPSLVRPGPAVNLLRWSAISGDNSGALAEAWTARQSATALRAAEARPPLTPNATDLVLAGQAGISQTVPLPDATTPPTDSSVQGLYYTAIFSLRQGQGPYRLSLIDADTNLVLDEVAVQIGANRHDTISVSLVALVCGRIRQVRVALDNLGRDNLLVSMVQQHLADRPNGVYVPTRDTPIINGGLTTSVSALAVNEHLVLPMRDEADRMPGVAGLVALSASTGRLSYHDGQRWLAAPRVIVGTQPPMEGAFLPGDECRNAQPGPGLPLSWVCVEGGSPGRWTVACYMPKG